MHSNKFMSRELSVMKITVFLYSKLVHAPIKSSLKSEKKPYVLKFSLATSLTI